AAALLQCPSRDANQVAAMPGPDQFAAFDSIDFTSLFRLDGRKSVVVGGGSGLGRAGAGFRNPGDTAPGWDAHPQVAGACPPRPRRHCRRTNGVAEAGHRGSQRPSLHALTVQTALHVTTVPERSAPGGLPNFSTT